MPTEQMSLSQSPPSIGIDLAYQVTNQMKSLINQAQVEAHHTVGHDAIASGVSYITPRDHAISKIDTIIMVSKSPVEMMSNTVSYTVGSFAKTWKDVAPKANKSLSDYLGTLEKGLKVKVETTIDPVEKAMIEALHKEIKQSKKDLGRWYNHPAVYVGLSIVGLGLGLHLLARSLTK